MPKDDETNKRIDILIGRLEVHLDRLNKITHLINSISDNKTLGEEIRKIIK